MARIIPIDYTKDEKALIVNVKMNSKLRVICICNFINETARVVHYSKQYVRKSHLPILRDKLEEFGFALIEDDALAYECWLYNARMFSNRI
jgi:hypothetical protein